MTCFSCGNETLMPGSVQLVGERHGQKFPVEIIGLKCTSCGFQTTDADHGNEFTRLVSDAYRSANGLLTGSEIVAARTQMGMSQQQFADYLGPGVASVKRWEAGKIQDRAMDGLIRLKTDPEVARRNLRSVEAHVPEQFVSSTGDFDLSFSVGQQQYKEKAIIKMDRMVWQGLPASDLYCEQIAA